MRRSDLKPILNTAFGRLLYFLRSERIVLFPLLLVEYGADSSDRTLLEDPKLLDPISSRD